MKHKPALIVGNWKLNPGTSSEAKTLVAELSKQILKKKYEATIVIAPTFLHIPILAPVVAKSTMALAAQDAHFEERGACTGEISPALLAEHGVSYVIVGHSERRALGESDVQINKKIHTLLKRKMTPIVCIGEKKRDEQGSFFNDIKAQLLHLCAGLLAAQVPKIVIAYEPIWAIGTGATATAEDVKEMQLFIVSVLTKLYDRKTAEKVTLIYGGSVKPSNAEVLYREGGMQGFLVGGASLLALEFIAIIEATLPALAKKK